MADTMKSRLILAFLLAVLCGGIVAVINGEQGLSLAALGSASLCSACFPSDTGRALRTIGGHYRKIAEWAAMRCLIGSIVLGSVLLIVGGLFDPGGPLLGVAGLVFVIGLGTTLVLAWTLGLGQSGVPARFPQVIPDAEAAQAEANELLRIEWEKERRRV